MARKLMVILVLILFVAASLSLAQEKKAAEKKEVKHEYIGEKKCKMCHKKDDTHPSWAKTPHANAFAVLDEKQQKNAECLVCHSTGVTAKDVVLEGVQCEACHGPGGDYNKMKIMKDQKLAIENGLLIPDEKTCKTCHNEKAPKVCNVKSEFDFEKMKAKGIHTLPEKKEAKPESKG